MTSQFQLAPERLQLAPERLDTASLVDQAGRLKETVSRLTEELRQLNQALARRAEFAPGSKTGRLGGRHFMARIVKRDNVVWNQEALADLRAVMGEADFFKIFKWEFKPVSEKTISGALNFSQYAARLGAACRVSEGAAQVTFTRLDS